MNTVLKLVRPGAPAQEDTNALPTLIELFELYVDRKRDKLKASTLKGYRQCIRTALAEWQKLHVDEITRLMVSNKHAEISNKNSQYGQGTGQADLVMRLLRALLNYARALYRDSADQPILKSNAVDVLKDAREWNKQRPRTNYLTESELPKFWRATQTTPHITVRDWLRLTLLTGFRKNEGRLLRWADIDFDKRIITVRDPKNGRTHYFPMTAFLFKMLKQRRTYAHPDIDFVFPHVDGTNSPMPYNTKRPDDIFAASGAQCTLHDLRRTYAQACYANELSEIAIKTLLNHSKHDVTGKHYLGGTNLKALRAPAQRVEEYILSYATGELVAASEIFEDEDEAEEIEPPKKIRIRLSLQPVEPIEQPVAKPAEKKQKFYKRIEPQELIKAVKENRAKIGGVEF
ncbi:MAG: hypothetical protein QG574_3741 [Cyanobacteriota bacterium erpe_2018_sw_21hr_WHONDRS-SW48-000092_B_bin.40]|jgi:integrase|nr:hypothetical protein [Cyanobacteriota bacterium erpe_2018_sw_21hr_WHONDRS-SW48-000092_B_bin.40]